MASGESKAVFKTKPRFGCLYKAGCFACDIDNSTEVSRASVFLMPLTLFFFLKEKRGKKKQKPCRFIAISAWI